MSASLIGRSGSSAFRLSTTTVSMSLTGSCFSTESAPRPFHHGISKTRWNNLLGGLAVRQTAGPNRHTISPHPSSREGHHSTARWRLECPFSNPPASKARGKAIAAARNTCCRSRCARSVTRRLKFCHFSRVSCRGSIGKSCSSNRHIVVSVKSVVGTSGCPLHEQPLAPVLTAGLRAPC
jgi:hypothetical protein